MRNVQKRDYHASCNFDNLQPVLHPTNLVVQKNLRRRRHLFCLNIRIFTSWHPLRLCAFASNDDHALQKLQSQIVKKVR